MKICTKCYRGKDIISFYKHKDMVDGHIGECKECVKARIRGDYHSNKTQPEWIIKEKARSKIKQRKRLTKNGGGLLPEQVRIPDIHGDKMKNFFEKYPEKYRAYIDTRSIFLQSSDHALHHWSYAKKHNTDIIKLTNKDHVLLHKHIYYDQKFMRYRTYKHALLTTKYHHIKYLKSIGCKPVKLTSIDYKVIKNKSKLRMNINSEKCTNKSALLDGFIIRAVDSQNIEYFGYNDKSTAFIQFRAGSTYFYKLDPLKHTEFLAGGFRKLTPIRKEFKKLITPKG